MYILTVYIQCMVSSSPPVQQFKWPYPSTGINIFQRKKVLEVLKILNWLFNVNIFKSWYIYPWAMMRPVSHNWIQEPVFRPCLRVGPSFYPCLRTLWLGFPISLEEMLSNFEWPSIYRVANPIHKGTLETISVN